MTFCHFVFSVYLVSVLSPDKSTEEIKRERGAAFDCICKDIGIFAGLFNCNLLAVT